MYNVSNKLNNQTEYYTTKVSGSRAEFGPNVSHYSASLCHGGTVSPSKMHHGGTIPPYKMHCGKYLIYTRKKSSHGLQIGI